MVAYSFKTSRGLSTVGYLFQPLNRMKDTTSSGRTVSAMTANTVVAAPATSRALSASA